MKSDKELVAFAVSYYASDQTIDDLVKIGGDLSIDEINRMMQLSHELEELLDRGGDTVKGIQKHQIGRAHV